MRPYVWAMVALLVGALPGRGWQGATGAATAGVAQPAWVAANGGADGAAVFALARDPDRPAIRYAGTSAGFARTIDSGATWTTLDVGLPPGCRVDTILPLREQPATLLAGCAHADSGSGLYRSDDRGAHWRADGTGTIPELTPYALIEGRTGVLLVGMEDGIYRSTDAGQSWMRVLAGTGQTLSGYSLAGDPFSPITYYVATSNGVYKSVDTGSSWFRANNGLQDTGSIGQIVADPTRRNRVFLGADRGIFRSSDGGNSWQGLGNAPQHVNAMLVQPLRAVPEGALTPDLRLILHPAPPSTKVTKGSKATKKPSLPKKPPVPTETALILAGTSGGVQASVDGGENWGDRTQVANDALAASGTPYAKLPDSTAVNALLSFGRSAEVLAGAGPGGVYRPADLGRSWRANGPGLGTGTPIDAIAVDPAHPGTVYYATEGSGVERSRNSGGSLEAVNDGLSDNQVVHDVLIQPARGERLVAALGTPRGGVAIFSGSSWSGAALSGHFANVVIADPHDPDTLYAGMSRGGVGWSADGGQSWRILSGGLPAAASVQSLAVDSHDALRILASTDHGLYLTTDQGDHWAAAGPGLPAGSVPALLAESTPRHGFLAGTGDGIYASTDGGGSWVATGALAGVAVSKLVRDSQDPRVLLAATNAGVYRSADAGTTWLALNAGFPAAGASSAVASAGRVAYAARASGPYFLSPTGPIPVGTPRPAQYFAPFGHGIAEPFLTFWRTHGGLPVFGYPHTEALRERGVLVQYFERGRLEYTAAAGIHRGDGGTADAAGQRVRAGARFPEDQGVQERAAAHLHSPERAQHR